jgi:predicted transposase YbfD/YdcC
MDSLIEHLKKIKDFRRPQGRRYALWLILLIVVLGLMAGHLGYRALGDFCRFQQPKFSKYLKIPRHQFPSYSTIRRVIMGVDWQNLIEVFNQWASQLTSCMDESRWFAIDGKCLKSTVENGCHNQQNFVSIVSVFCQENGLVAHLAKIENKHTSEIHQVQDIIKNAGFSDKVLSMDAAHCQKPTVNATIESGNDYLIAVKKNQRKLHKCLENLAENTIPLSHELSEDKSHGRHINREVSVFSVPETIQALWKGSQKFIQVKRSGIRGKNKPYQETAYYLSSCLENSQVFGEKIRGHWGIENQLHWVKDVVFQEDNSPIHHFQSMTNLSVLSTIAMNLYRFLGFLSITTGRRWLSQRLWGLHILLE